MKHYQTSFPGKRLKLNYLNPPEPIGKGILQYLRKYIPH